MRKNQKQTMSIAAWCMSVLMLVAAVSSSAFAAEPNCPHSNVEYWEATDEGHTGLCPDCGEVVTLEHESSVIWDENYHWEVCTVCGARLDYKAEHRFSAWQADSGSATHSRKCMDCGYAETEGHFHDNWVSNHDRSFLNNGTKNEVCWRCGEVLTENEFESCSWLVTFAHWLGGLGAFIVHVAVEPIRMIVD